MNERKAVSRTWIECPTCGYHNEQDEGRCDKCGRRLRSSQRWAPGPQSNLAICRILSPAFGGNIRPTTCEPRNAYQAADSPELPENPGNNAGGRRPGAPHHESLRRQLGIHVKDFRSRRLNGNLPFNVEEGRLGNEGIPLEKMSSPPVQVPSPLKTQHRPRRTPSRIQQQALNFPSFAGQTETFLALPVAPVRLRLVSHGIDFALSLAALLVFLLPLKLVGGPVVLNRFLLMGSICAYLLLVLLYGILFLYLAGATPTMKWTGLRLVNFDGMPPPRHQLLYRFLGAIASAGSFFLGFLWAAVDEEKLSWHDRISKTFLTTANR